MAEVRGFRKAWECGLRTGKHAPGPLNDVTDVEGVLVGTTTIIRDSPVVARTGVTVIFPRKDIWSRYCHGGYFSFNGAGELTGAHRLEETGNVVCPILITSTHEVGNVRDYVVQYALKNGLVEDWLVPLVGETYDGMFNDPSQPHIKYEDVEKALEGAASGKVEQGNVGGGTGNMCHEFKGGTGTSSRVVEILKEKYTVGVLVQSNYGRREQFCIEGKRAGHAFDHIPSPSYPPTDGSIIVVIATDAPLLPVQCKRMAKRATVGISRMGGVGHNDSGDIFVCFSTANSIHQDRVNDCKCLPDTRAINPLFEAAAEATEEAILNVLLNAKSMTGFKGYHAHQFELGNWKSSSSSS